MPTDPDLLCVIDANSGKALLPLDEYAPLLEQVQMLFDDRDALAARNRELEALMRCHLCQSPPVYHEGGRWTCAACWLRTNP